MENKSNVMYKVIIAILSAVIVGLIIFIGIKLEWFGSKNEISQNNIINNYSNGNFVNDMVGNIVNNSVGTNTIENNNHDNEPTSSEKIKKIEISGEELLNILLDTAPFDDGTNLSTQQYLEIVYNALNENYISEYKNRREKGKDSAEYTAEEINGIVYSLFGVTMPNNESMGSALVYKNGKYTLQFSDRGTSVPIAKNVENDVAAGSIYITYDLYYKGDGDEVLEGNFTIRKSSVTTFVKSKIKN